MESYGLGVCLDGDSIASDLFTGGCKPQEATDRARNTTGATSAPPRVQTIRWEAMAEAYVMTAPA
jgi:hypothetical protein